MKNWLFNPFRYIAGTKALGIGIVAMVAIIAISRFSHAGFDGILHTHFGNPPVFYVYVVEQVVLWLSTVIVFYIIGLILSKTSVRFIDVAGTMALARWPMIFVALLCFLHPDPMPASLNVDAQTIVIAFISLVFCVWLVALMYNAFVVCCNLKGGKAVMGFIAGILLAELLCRFVLYQFYLHDPVFR